MKNFLIIIGIFAATMFFSCSNKVYKPLSENRNILRDTLSEVNVTSKLMTSRKSIFNIPKSNLLVLEETRIHENPEENNVRVVVTESNRKRLYEEEFSPKNMREFYANKESMVYGGYFHLVSTNSKLTNCYVRHIIEDNSIEFVIITPNIRYFIEYDLNNLLFTPIGFLTKYIPPEMKEEKRKDNY